MQKTSVKNLKSERKKLFLRFVFADSEKSDEKSRFFTSKKVVFCMKKPAFFSRKTTFFCCSFLNRQ
ncbi:MAG: hypothetical protein IJ250_08385, partial [Bacteroidales bacterium]|nr:hypothetical protein [Bacteroidales bacterium]